MRFAGKFCRKITRNGEASCWGPNPILTRAPRKSREGNTDSEPWKEELATAHVAWPRGCVRPVQDSGVLLFSELADLFGPIALKVQHQMNRLTCQSNKRESPTPTHRTWSRASRGQLEEVQLNFPYGHSIDLPSMASLYIAGHSLPLLVQWAPLGTQTSQSQADAQHP